MFETFVINLPTYPKRWKEVEKQIIKSDLKTWRRVDGIYGEQVIKDSKIISSLAPGVLSTIESKVRKSHDEHSVGSLGICYI